MNIGILIFDEVEVLDFCGPFEVFSVASLMAVNLKKRDEAPFGVFTIAERPGIIKARGNLLVQPHFTITDHPPVDLLLVPGGQGTRKEVNNPALIGWIAKVAEQSKLNTSVCTGSFMLGKAGLLEGKKVTTHWLSLDRMADSFPQVQVQRGVRWVDEGQVVTSAGISAGIDMSLHLVERILGRVVAEATAKQMEYIWNDEG
jgi:transcriptional regulator GlxA family with amidase domain